MSWCIVFILMGSLVLGDDASKCGYFGVLNLYIIVIISFMNF